LLGGFFYAQTPSSLGRFGLKKPSSFFEKKCKVFEQLPPSQDHGVILFSIPPSSLGRFGHKKNGLILKKKMERFLSNIP
jgi:hypothetical protein